MIEINDLKKYAEKIEFTLKEEEYKTLQNEFEIILKQFELIDKIDTLKDYEPMAYPFLLEDSYFREDEVTMSLSSCDALKNCKDTESSCVKLPKVVG